MFGAWQIQLVVRRKGKNGEAGKESISSLDIPKLLKDLPESYYVGQEFVEDEKRIEVHILFKFRTAVNFSNLNFDEGALHVRQIGTGEVLCTIEKTVSDKLFRLMADPMDFDDDERVQGFLSVNNFVLGYIRPYLPAINERIQIEKYRDGHILARPVAIFDLYEVAVLDKNNRNSGAVIPWPAPLSGWEESRLAEGNDAVFIRDLIDAMTAYYEYDLDECLRKIITSLENCFSHYSLSVPSTSIWERARKMFWGKRGKFKRLINTYLVARNYPFPERDLLIVRANIKFIYHLRNLIVHDKLRVNPSQTTLCRKAIATLLYIYQGHYLRSAHRVYIFSFYAQFFSIYDSMTGYSLETAAEDKPTISRKANIIRNADDMNRMMFASLSITKAERDSVLTGARISPRASKIKYSPNTSARPQSQPLRQKKILSDRLACIFCWQVRDSIRLLSCLP